MSNTEINATAASLLGFLHAGTMTGWDLDGAVDATISNFWNVTRSQVYRELRTLAKLGYVEAGAAGPRERRPYTITQQGREVFARWIARDPGPPLIRFPLLLTVFFGQHLPPARLKEIVEAERSGYADGLKEFQAMYDANRDAAPFVAEVIRFGIGFQEHMIAWLDSLPTGGDRKDE
jgi:DNA-binding PadR family transcriptional regulator